MDTKYWISITVLSALLVIAGYWCVKRWRRKRRIRELKIALDAQERERERIAKDLHDYFGARLSTLKLYMQTINKYDARRIATMTDVAMQMIDSTIVELRHLLYDLNPKKLYQGGLIDALKDMIHSLKSILKFDINVDFSSYSARLEYSAEVSVYRIVQELINNTLKHANATNIDIRLGQEKKELLLEYADNGIGFDSGVTTFGYGLRNIHQHALALGASMKVVTEPQKGFACKFSIPFK